MIEDKQQKLQQATTVETRPATNEPALAWPEPRAEVIDAFVGYLIDKEGMCRPPVQAAKLLAFIVELHKSKPPKPFPPRKDVASHLDMGLPTIDAALSSRIAQGYLKQVVDYIEGNVANRASSRKVRFYVPSSDLIELWEVIYGKIRRAERKEALKDE